MHAVYDKISINTARHRLRKALPRRTVASSWMINSIHWSHVYHRWWCKNAQKCNIFLLIMVFPGRLLPR